MTNKWFRVSSNRSASKRQLAGKAGFGDLGVGERGVRDKEGEGTHMLEEPQVKRATKCTSSAFTALASEEMHSLTSLFHKVNWY